MKATAEGPAMIPIQCAKLENVSNDDTMANIFEFFQLQIYTHICV